MILISFDTILITLDVFHETTAFDLHGKREKMTIKKMASLFLFSIGILFCAACATEPAFEGFGVSSDVDSLRRVIVLTPGKGGARQSYWLYTDDPFINLNYDEGTIAQHDRMKKKLRESGIEILELETLLESALRNARAEGKLESALEEVFPHTFPLVKKDMPFLKPEDLLGRTDAFLYSYDEEGRFRSLFEPAIALYFTRDFAVMTPKGLILTNARMSYRRVEHRLGRFVFSYADSLRDCPILFDASKEEVFCEGGDILVRDETTIFMGIHNFSDSKAARKIAQALDMDVIAVSMPSAEEFSGANVEIMHLDTVFNFVDRNKILTVPYLFEREYAEENPIVNLLGSIERSLRDSRPLDHAEKTYEDSQTGSGERESADQSEPESEMSLAKSIKQIPRVGWLTRFQAGSGEAEDLKTKLVDYLRAEGYTTIWVGGEQGELREDKYILERVFYELSLQAANVVQLAPGKVLAYAHNSHTIQALRAAGVEVVTFEGKYLADGLGGPHCLTMPVLRERNPEKRESP